MNSLALKDDSTWIFSNGSLRTSNLQDSNYHSSYFIYLAVVSTTRVMQRSMVRRYAEEDVENRIRGRY